MTLPTDHGAKSPESGANAAEELAYRLRQQALGAKFGLFALRTHETADLLQEASRLSALGMQTDFSKVMEYLPDEHQFVVRAGVGWKSGVVGQGRAGADLESPAGYAFQTGQPVISNHLQEETRFRTPAILVEHGVKRAINVLIRGDGRRFGILEVDSRDEGRFTEADLAFLTGLANVIGVAIERQAVEEALRANQVRLQAAISRQDMLTREMSHRVKNSLGVVVSLLDMQSRESREPELHRALSDAKSRIHAIAQVHDWLWRSDDVGLVDLAGFMRELSTQLELSNGAGKKLLCEVAPLQVMTDRAVLLGLLVNELVTNAFKYAYPNSAGEVRLKITAVQPGRLLLEVADDGIGLPDDFDSAARTSLGMRLIATLSRQLGGEAGWRSLGKGTRFTLYFPA